MIKSKPWNWDMSDNNFWNIPADEFIPIAVRWNKKGFNKVLDLGCGTGRHSIYLAENGFSVDAFDLAPDGVKKFKERIKNLNFKINIKVGDMLSLPYRENTFDCLLAIHTVYHTDMLGLRKVIKNIYNILKPNGEAFVTFNSKENDSWKKYASRQIDRNTLIKTEEAEIDVPHTYLDYTEVVKLLKKFKIIRIQQIFNYWNNQKYAHFFVLIKKKDTSA